MREDLKDFKAHIERQLELHKGMQDYYLERAVDYKVAGDEERVSAMRDLLGDTNIRVEVYKSVLESFNNIVKDEDKNESADMYYRVGSECVYEGEAHKELCGLVGHIRAVFKWEVLVEFDVEDTDELWPVYRLPKDDIIPF